MVVRSMFAINFDTEYSRFFRNSLRWCSLLCMSLFTEGGGHRGRLHPAEVLFQVASRREGYPVRSTFSGGEGRGRTLFRLTFADTGEREGGTLTLILLTIYLKLPANYLLLNLYKNGINAISRASKKLK